MSLSNTRRRCPWGPLLVASAPMDNRFGSVMAQRTDTELVEIVTVQRGDYEEEALGAAQAELERRGLEATRLEDVRQAVVTTHEERSERANEPLLLGWKILSALLPGLVTLAVANKLKMQGYDRQYEDAKRWMWGGLAVYVGGPLILGFLGWALRISLWGH